MKKIAVLNAGGQYCHLIARKIRELGVYAEIMDFNASPKELKQTSGVILSGGPDSVYSPDSPKVSKELFDSGIPVLGICYGHQLMAKMLGGEVKPSKTREYGIANMRIEKNNSIFDGLGQNQTIWMSHGDSVEKLPDGFEVLSSSENCKITSMANSKKSLYGLQFHPEVSHTINGRDMLKNFVFSICKIKEKAWKPKNNIASLINEIKSKADGRKVFFFVSGGIDSTVAFILCVKALGKDNVKGVYVDTGFMRKDETNVTIEDFRRLGLDNIDVIDESSRFINILKDEYDPEKKREIIGKHFVNIKNEEFNKIEAGNDLWVLGQGTIYPDTIESGCSTYSSKIKTHHNRVEEIVKLLHDKKVIEPLAEFYKDEVRVLAEALGLPKNIVNKEPFPGPGLSVRCICSPEEKPVQESTELTNVLSKHGLKGFIAPVKTVGVQGDYRSYKDIAVIYNNIPFSNLVNISSEITNNISTINRVAYIVKTKESNPDKMMIHERSINNDRLGLLKEADYIVRNFVEENKRNLPEIWQFPIIIFPLGCNGNESIALRPILSTDGMTAKFAEINKTLLEQAAQRILKLNGISTVLYDITNKPPATIEWE
jgi:GMP synthase (glutamine-hydrolysing)